jgi:DNA-binding NarL/FixJ family response regulator
MHQNPAFAFQAIRAGAKGYVTKSSDPSVLIHAVYEVYGHQLSLSPDIAQALALSQFAGGRAALSELTVREFEIFRMLCEARTTEEIADLLHISPKTVSNSHYQIKKKLGVSGDIELVHLALDWNVVDLLRKST